MVDDVMSFWWENITGPQMMIEEIVRHLTEGKNVVLRLDVRLPWTEQMRDLVMHQLERARLELLSWADVHENNEIVPKILKNIRRGGLDACPSGYDSQLAYLKNEGIFRNSVVWVVPEGEGEQPLLVRFLSDYRGKGLEEHGVFVAEIPAGQHLPKLSGSTAVVNSKDYIRHGDLLLYANVLVDGERKFPAEYKGYIACVAANLAGRNAGLVPVLLGGIDFENEDPKEAFCRLWEQGYLDELDVLPDGQELEQRLWKAQLQSAFAGIEMERLKIANEHAAEIEEAIATKYWEPKWNRYGYITQYGEELSCASDVELGTLVRMMNLRRGDEQKQYLLYFPDEQLRGWITFLTECRNRLAHHKTCTPEQMKHLLGSLQK